MCTRLDDCSVCSCLEKCTLHCGNRTYYIPLTAKNNQGLGPGTWNIVHMNLLQTFTGLAVVAHWVLLLNSKLNRTAAMLLY